MILISQQKSWMGYLAAGILLVLATVIAIVLSTFVAPTNLVMLYLLVVVITAVRWGYGPAVITSGTSVIVFNFFFVPHEYTLRVADAQYLLTFIGLFVVGIVIADLTNRVRRQASTAYLRETQTAELYALSRDLVATINADKIVDAVLRHVSDTFQAEVAIFLFEKKQLQLHAKTTAFQTTEKTEELAQWVFDHSNAAGAHTVIWPESDTICLPLATIQEKIGIMALQFSKSQTKRDQQRRMLDAFANQAALAIEAARLAEQAQQTRLLREREKLHTAVLNSISHDLRTPLVSISGTLSTLRDQSVDYPEHTRRDLLDGAWLEAQRLNRIVANLLDMTRLQTGMIQLKYDWYDVQELIAIARSHLSERLEGRPLHIDIEPNLPLIQMDLTLMAQVLTNLLDNALKYSDDGTELGIHIFVESEQLVVEVMDRGSGIPEEDLPHIFETFYRAHRTGGIGGTGLGLSICEGITTAHHGTIEAQNRIEGGALFSIRLPIHNTPIYDEGKVSGFENQDQSISH